MAEIVGDSETSRFDDLVGSLNYPMLIVTVADGRRRAGCLVGFATQCGIDPSRFMVWLSKRNYTHQLAQRAEVLAVHVPAAHQRGLAKLFGSQTGHVADKFAQCAWRPGPHGVPLLVDCPQWFIGRILTRFDTGDHEGCLLEPIEVSRHTGLGQLDFDQVRDIEPGTKP